MTLRIPVMGTPETAPAVQASPVASPQERSSSVAPQTDRRPEPPLRQPQDEAPNDQLTGFPPAPDDPWRQGNDAFSLHQASQLNVRRALRVDVLLPFYLDRADSLVGETPAPGAWPIPTWPWDFTWGYAWRSIRSPGKVWWRKCGCSIPAGIL